MLRNDEIDVAGIAALAPDALVLSPGPVHAGRGGRLRARRSRSFAGKLPILGVCLGHQAIGAALGGKVVRAAAPDARQDRRSRARRPRRLRRPAARASRVIRYHSLAIERASLPAALDVTSTASDGEIMGVRHRALAGSRTPLEGVQFHPESILTEHGHAMLKNFLDALP